MSDPQNPSITVSVTKIGQRRSARTRQHVCGEPDEKTFLSLPARRNDHENRQHRRMRRDDENPGEQSQRRELRQEDEPPRNRERQQHAE